MQTPTILSSENGWLKIAFSGDFSTARTAFCGQCFRFSPLQGEFPPPPSGCSAAVFGIAYGRAVAFADDGTYLYVYASAEDFENIWRHYLSLDEDYTGANEKILKALSGAGQAHMHAALNAARGIRILHQEPWETLCSFIISQNNNIPRIRKIIEALCREYGEKIPGGWAFPTPQALARCRTGRYFCPGGRLSRRLHMGGRQQNRRGSVFPCPGTDGRNLRGSPAAALQPARRGTQGVRLRFAFWIRQNGSLSHRRMDAEGHRPPFCRQAGPRRVWKLGRACPAVPVLLRAVRRPLLLTESDRYGILAKKNRSTFCGQGKYGANPSQPPLLC